MTLKYNKFKCYWAAVTEKKSSNSVYREGPSLCAQILNEKSAFLRPKLSLKTKTITNQFSEYAVQFTLKLPK